jgi:hypothetical protein
MFVNKGQWSVQVSNVFLVPTCLTLVINSNNTAPSIGKIAGQGLELSL